MRKLTHKEMRKGGGNNRAFPVILIIPRATNRAAANQRTENLEKAKFVHSPAEAG